MAGPSAGHPSRRAATPVAMHADVAITIILGGFVALTALVASVALLRGRLRAGPAEEEDGDAVTMR